MTDIDEIRTLLSLVCAQHGPTHTECVRALSWLRVGEGSAPADTPTRRDSATRSPRDRSSGDEARETTVPYADVKESLADWLTRHASPITNWFVMHGADFDRCVAALEPHIRITGAQPYAPFPGAFVVMGLWRARTGVDAAIFFPPCFNPRDRLSPVALQVTCDGNTVLLQVAVGSLLAGVNQLLRQVTSGGHA